MSRLTQARGLKPERIDLVEYVDLSRLTQARGLKHHGITDDFLRYWVAPHAGAWIETQVLQACQPFLLVAPHAGAWIETRIVVRSACSASSRASRRRVD